MNGPGLASQPKRYAAKREEIVAAATDILNEDGVSGFTLAAVSRRVRLNPASLAYYFKRKDELVALCLIDALGRLDALAAEAETRLTPAERVDAFVTQTFALRRRILLKEEPGLASFNEIRLVEPPFREPVMDAFWSFFRRVGRLFGPGYGEVERNVRARLVIEQLMWARVWLAQYDEMDYARASSRLSDVLINGVMGPGQAFAANDPKAPQTADESAEVSRETFLVAATELINARGYRGASVDKISAELKVTKGSFYYHNSDKNELVAACFGRTFDIMTAAQHEALRAEGSAATRLASAVSTLVSEHATGRRRLLRAYALSALSPEQRLAMIQRLQDIAHRFAGLISDGVSDGSLRAVDPMIAAQALMAAVNSAAYVEFWSPGASASAMVSLYARPALTGLFTAPLIDDRGEY
jgi:AcrR family transcriptional regulator